MAKKYWGFDTKNIDKSVRPQDDFYQYANGAWLKKAKIPATESRWGSFTMLRHKTDNHLRAIIKDVLKNKSAKPGSPEQLVRDLYQAASDMKTRNTRGAKPLVAPRMLVREAASKEELLKVLARLQVMGVSSGWGTIVDQDSKNSSRYLLHLWQGGLGMPDRDYYLLDKPEQKRVREAYREHIRHLLKLCKFSHAEAEVFETSIMKIETALARASMRKEDTRDPEKVYHKYSVAQLQKLSPAINWPTYFDRTHAKKLKELIVGQPEFFKALSNLLNDLPLEDWKHYVEWCVIGDYSSMLSAAFVKEHFSYNRVLSGQKKMRPLWRRALGAVGYAGQALGKLYVERYFPQSSKHAMDELVSDLFAVYQERILSLDWMTTATKRKAIKKLQLMSRKIGYPKKWELYKGLEIDSTDHFGNVLRAEEWWHKKHMRKLGGPVDRNEWFMSPQTVNAYFSPNLNDIVFPAAILQWPFFDPKADAAINYAGIGSVIGHEMTHGFDDQGAKFDGKGNMVQWWTSADKKRFEKKSKAVIAQYGKYEAADGVMVNGQLTLGENIADFGGLAIAWGAYQKHLKKIGRKEVAGFSPEQRFFFGFAQMERELTRPEHAKTAALTDPHSPAPTRINGPLANFEPFYELFGVKKGDKLYRDPKVRSTIW